MSKKSLAGPWLRSTYCDRNVVVGDPFISYDIIPFVFSGFVDSLTSSSSISLHGACALLRHVGIVCLIIILTGNSNPNFKLLGPDIFNSLFSLHLIPKWDPRAEFSLVVFQMKSCLSMLGLKSQFILN